MNPEKLAAARKAKAEAEKRYGRADWFRGAGLAPHGDGLAVRLNVAPEGKEHARSLPKELAGVPLEIVIIEGYAPRSQD
jgi:hypothetical protein